MKKNDDGYVLPFVLVVLIVMALVATTALSAALRNINTQQNFIKRMEVRYMAEGEIERVRAELMNPSGYTVSVSVGETEKDAIQKKIEATCNTELDFNIGEGDIDVSPVEPLNPPGDFTCIFTLVSTASEDSNNVTVTATMELKGKIQQNSGSYMITPTGMKYLSYEIGGTG